MNNLSPIKTKPTKREYQAAEYIAEAKASPRVIASELRYSLTVDGRSIQMCSRFVADFEPIIREYMSFGCTVRIRDSQTDREWVNASVDSIVSDVIEH